MNYTEFENKIKSMNAHDIIMAMVEGLRKPRTKIDMATFGRMRDGICYGCAATNAILHIMKAREDELENYIIVPQYRAYLLSAVYIFESAIDWLRRGRVGMYNLDAKYYGFAKITPIPGLELPCLENDYTEDQLQEYVKLAEYQLTA